MLRHIKIEFAGFDSGYEGVPLGLGVDDHRTVRAVVAVTHRYAAGAIAERTSLHATTASSIAPTADPPRNPGEVFV
jgi:hypothetical protein